MRLNIKETVLPFGNGVFFYGSSESDRIAKCLIPEYAGKVSCIYLDPPFCTGDKFTKEVLATHVLAYTDEMNFVDYMDTMRTVLTLARELLTNDGSIYLHIDYRMSAYIRLLLDEIFGANNFMNEIIWAYKSGGSAKNHYPRKHDTIYLYKKKRDVYFDIESVGTIRGTKRRNNMKYNVDEDGLVYYSIMSGGKLYKYYENDLVYPTDVWCDIEHLHQRDSERVGYPTQKPEALLERVVSASSRQGDIVCDLFSGSGTTAAVSCRLNRRFVVVDSSLVACATLAKRLIAMYSDTANTNANVNTNSRFEYGNAKHSIQRRVSFNSRQVGSCVEIEVRNAERLGVDTLIAGAYDGESLNATTYNINACRYPVIRVPNEDNAALQVILKNGEFSFFSLNEILSVGKGL